MAEVDIAEEVTEVDEVLDELSTEMSEKIDVSTESIGTDSDFIFNVSSDIEDATSSAAESEMSELSNSATGFSEESLGLNEAGDDSVSSLASENLDESEIADSLVNAKAEEEAAANPSAGDGGLKSTLIKVGKGILIVSNVYLLLDFFGKQIYGLVKVIEDAMKNPDWKSNLTADDRTTITTVQNAIMHMKTIIQSWKLQWETLKQDPVGLGTLPVTIGGKMRQVPVIDIIYFILRDMQAVSVDSYNYSTDKIIYMISSTANNYKNWLLLISKKVATNKLHFYHHRRY